jgi:hypothetical protein
MISQFTELLINFLISSLKYSILNFFGYMHALENNMNTIVYALDCKEALPACTVYIQTSLNSIAINLCVYSNAYSGPLDYKGEMVEL